MAEGSYIVLHSEHGDEVSRITASEKTIFRIWAELKEQEEE